MAIITKGKFTNTNPDLLNDQHGVIELELVNRNFIFTDETPYVTAIVGDNKSQVLTFKTPKEYDGIDLQGTFCILTYWTSWVDDEYKHSKGYIVLNEVENEDKEHLYFNWVLDINQTGRAGQCKFTLTFYLPLEDAENKSFYEKYGNEFFNNINNIGEIEFVQDDVVWKIKNDEGIIEYPYYSLSSNSGNFTIVDPGMGEGGPLYIEGNIITQLINDLNEYKQIADQQKSDLDALYTEFKNNVIITSFNEEGGN